MAAGRYDAARPKEALALLGIPAENSMTLSHVTALAHEQDSARLQ